MKRQCLIAIVAAVALAAAADAEVVLPESRHLAGPVDALVTEFGDEFLGFPDFMQPQPAPGRTLLNGWLSIRFGEPVDGRVVFDLSWDMVGTPFELEWGGGQVYRFAGNRYRPQPTARSFGVLDLATGAVTDISVNAVFQNDTIVAKLTKTNRLPYGFFQSYPPPDLGVPLPPLPPGFLAADGRFLFDAEGHITGFDFLGQTIVPVGLFAFANNLFQLFPLYTFGPRGEFYFTNPDRCLDGTPPASCPTDADQPDGIALPAENFLHPHFLIRADRLREVPAARSALPCLPAARTDGADLVTNAGQVYLVGGLENGQASDRVWIFDPHSHTWREGPNLPVPVVDTHVVATPGKLWVAGGRERRGGPATGRLQVLDLATGTWRQAPPAPRALAHAAPVAVGEWLFFIGGKTNRANGSLAGNLRFTDSMLAFDPFSGLWFEMPLTPAGAPPLWLTDANAVTLGPELVILGGRRADGGLSNQVLILDLITGEFRFGPPMLEAVYGASAAVLGDRIYVAGGRTAIDGPATTRVQLLERGRDTWIDSHPLPVPIADGDATEAYGRILLAPGRSPQPGDAAPGPPSHAFQALDPSAGWALCAGQPIFGRGGVLPTAGLIAAPPVLAPGAQATVVGYNFPPPAFANPTEPTLPTTLSGLSIDIGGRPASILAVTPNRVDFVVPEDAPTGDDVSMTLRLAGATRQARPVSTTIAAEAPTLFVQSCGETHVPGYLDGASAIACHDDGTLVYPANAVPPGGVVALQASGLGASTPPLPPGSRTPPDGVFEAVTPPRAEVRVADGTFREAPVLSARLAPGEAGIWDVRVQLPNDVAIANRVGIALVTDDGRRSNEAVVATGERLTQQPVPCGRDSQPAMRFCLPPTPPQP